jgi:hypothetical protein
VIVCVNCNRIMRPVKIGTEIVEVVLWELPTRYRLWDGDEWRCAQCGYTVVLVLPSQTPIAEHFQDGFQERAKDAIEAKEWNVP